MRSRNRPVPFSTVFSLVEFGRNSFRLAFCGFLFRTEWIRDYAHLRNSNRIFWQRLSICQEAVFQTLSNAFLCICRIFCVDGNSRFRSRTGDLREGDLVAAVELRFPMRPRSSAFVSIDTPGGCKPGFIVICLSAERPRNDARDRSQL